MSDVSAAKDRLRNLLNEMGVHYSIDDGEAGCCDITLLVSLSDMNDEQLGRLRGLLEELASQDVTVHSNADPVPA